LLKSDKDYVGVGVLSDIGKYKKTSKKTAVTPTEKRKKTLHTIML
jgi:hypothetical protein